MMCLGFITLSSAGIGIVVVMKFLGLSVLVINRGPFDACAQHAVRPAFLFSDLFPLYLSQYEYPNSRE